MKLPFFDRVATAVDKFTSKAIFFSMCAGMVIVWAPSYFLFKNVDTWQLVINTGTTIVTFLLVALLQNTSRRSSEALHKKLDAIAEGVADLIEDVAGDGYEEDMHELRRAVGLEERTTTKE